MTPTGTPSIYREELFKDKGIIVTGGGTGLGLAISKELASLGAKVVIAARNLERLEDAAKELNSLGKGRVWAHRCNVRSEEDIHALVSFALETMGRVDGLVNNAGGQFVSQVEDISAKGFKAVLETNLLSTFMLSKEVFNRFMSAHGGSIVNITVANANGFPMMAHSGAARAGVENLAKSMALEWVGSGVRVNCVAPGVIYTESGFANYGPMGETFLANLLPGIPCKRCGTAEEVSSAVVWLLSEASVYVTGQTVGVDGGIGQTHIPLRQHEDRASLMPPYGELSPKAKL